MKKGRKKYGGKEEGKGEKGEKNTIYKTEEL